MGIVIGNEWDELLKPEFEKEYYKNLREFLIKEYQEGEVYPKADDIFNAFRYTDYKDVKAVILGQDPYHEPGQAHGLAFSVPGNVKYPPSLVNIFKELETDQGVDVKEMQTDQLYIGNSSSEWHRNGGSDISDSDNMNDSVYQSDTKESLPEEQCRRRSIVPSLRQRRITIEGTISPVYHPVSQNEGVLVPWAERGVLLLNTVLTVRAHRAGSHRGHGWEQFTDAVIKLLSARPRPMVFILWGANAISKKEIILDASQQAGVRHLIITAPHPSPLSAYRGFFGGRYFSRTNYFLEDSGMEPIDWSL